MRRHDAAFARRDLLVRIEGEDARGAVRADGSASVLSAERFAGILDQREPMAVGERAELVVLARVAVDVDRDDRLRPLGDRSLDRLGDEIERPPVDIGEDRDPTLVEEAVRARCEGIRRGDHLVAGPNSGRDREQMQARRAGGDGRGVRCFHPLGDQLLETVDRRAERKPARAENFEHELFLALAEVRPRERDRRHLLPHALLRAAGAYSSHWLQRSLRPCTVSR